jgi:imidazolonepropionase
MAERIDLLVYSAGQVARRARSRRRSQRGRTGTLAIVEDGAVAVHAGRIIEVGNTRYLRSKYTGEREIDAVGHVIVPGFVDPHTHLVWAGDRAAEFEMRIAGKSYMEIMQAGGGINSTVRHVRAASVDQLVAETRPRLGRMLRHGTTTVEIKTGYGLDTPNEIAIEAITAFARSIPSRSPTFLAAHAVRRA